MRHFIGFILSWTCYYIGNLFSKISYLENKKGYLIDNNYPEWFGNFVFNQYQNFMHYSSLLQDWAGNKGPWKDTQNK